MISLSAILRRRAVIDDDAEGHIEFIPNLSLMTGTQVVWTRLRNQFWDRLLELSLLAPYDRLSGLPISPYHRTMLAAGKLALSHIQQYRDKGTIVEPCLLDLLADTAIRLGLDHKTKPHWTVNFDFLISVQKEFRDVSFSSSEHGNSPLPHCLHHIRRYYLRSCFMPGFPFPCLDYHLHTWPSFYDYMQYDSDFTFTRSADVEGPMIIMRQALQADEQAYRIFIDEDWMGILFMQWVICGSKGEYLNVIGGYINGLRTLTALLLSNRRKFCEYLHQPQQLTIACMLIVAVGGGPNFSWLEGRIVELAKIWPTHASWRDCHTALHDILTWAQTPNPEISLFPWPSSLQSLDTTEAFRKYPLVEWTARRFAMPDMREKLKIALDALREVLENAEHVDGVLMPDLENLNAPDKASALGDV
ncbi:hypothetical protein CPB85DRAFT_1329231, partial [Mucidula mucida]